MRQRRHRVTLMLASIAFSLLMAEGVLRLTEDHRPWKRKLHQEGRILQTPAWAYDPLIGARFTPQWTGRYFPSSGEEFVQVRSNRWGFRFPEYDLEKLPGTRRVALLGDSVTAALQVEADAHFRALLEGALNLHQPTEVLNFGIPGTGPVAHLNVYRHFARRFDPDVVVIGIYTGNDFTDDTGIAWREKDGSFTEQPFVDAPGNLRKLLKANSALVMAAWSLTVRGSGRSSPAETADAGSAASDEPYVLAGVSRQEYDNKVKVWKSLIDSILADSARCVVLFYPEEAVLSAEGRWQYAVRKQVLHDLLSRELERPGAEMITGSVMLERHGDRYGTVPWAKRGDYLSEAGHKSLASVLSERLLRRPGP